MCGFIFELLILFYWSIHLSLCKHHTGLISFAVSFKIEKCKFYNFVYLFQDCFGYPEPPPATLARQYELGVWFLHFCKKKKKIWVCIGIALYLCIAVGSKGIPNFSKVQFLPLHF